MRTKCKHNHRVIFITGTDTGVGKTVLTAFWVRYLHECSHNAIAIKPISTGDRTDAQLLLRAQSETLSLDTINPYHFPLPAAPLLAAQKAGSTIRVKRVLDHIRRLRTKFEVVLVEGVGGLLVPITHTLTVRDVIRRLKCHVVIVAPNKLGVINHALLTVEALQKARPLTTTVVLMDPPVQDPVTIHNPMLLQKLLRRIPVLQMPYLGSDLTNLDLILHNNDTCKKVLADLTKRVKLINGSSKEEEWGRKT